MINRKTKKIQSGGASNRPKTKPSKFGKIAFATRKMIQHLGKRALVRVLNPLAAITRIGDSKSMPGAPFSAKEHASRKLKYHNPELRKLLKNTILRNNKNKPIILTEEQKDMIHTYTDTPQTSHINKIARKYVKSKESMLTRFKRYMREAENGKPEKYNVFENLKTLLQPIQTEVQSLPKLPDNTSPQNNNILILKPNAGIQGAFVA